MNPSPVFETIAEFAELRADHRFNCAPGANRRRPWLFRGHAERGRKESEVRGNCGNHIDYWLYPLQPYGVVKRHQKQARSDADPFGACADGDNPIAAATGWPPLAAWHSNE
jgi:hypothetical protein